MPKIIPIGNDDGHASIKQCFGWDQKTKRFLLSKRPSLATRGESEMTLLGSPDTYHADGEVYTISDNMALSYAIDTRSLNFPTSALNRVLVHHALIQDGFAGQDVFLVTGLPVDQFYSMRKLNDDLINAKMQNISGPISSRNEKVQFARIRGNRVFCEGMAAFYNSLIDHDGNLDEKLAAISDSRPVFVLDLGGKTLDYAYIQEQRKGINDRLSGTRDIGVIDMKQELASLIKAKLHLNYDVPIKLVDESLETFTFDNIDITDIIQESCRRYFEDVRRAFFQVIRDGSFLGAVICVGGGTALLTKVFGPTIFNELTNRTIIIPTEPEFANAIGNWKAAKYMFEDELNELAKNLSAQEKIAEPA